MNPHRFLDRLPVAELAYALFNARRTTAGDESLISLGGDVEHASQSHFNCERAGLRTITANTIWVKEA